MSMSILELINSQRNNNNNSSIPTLSPQLKSAFNLIRNSANPQLALQSFLNQNPNYQQIMNLIQSNGNPQQLFYTLAQQRGVDPNAILQQLQQ